MLSVLFFFFFFFVFYYKQYSSSNSTWRQIRADIRCIYFLSFRRGTSNGYPQYRKDINNFWLKKAFSGNYDKSKNVKIILSFTTSFLERGTNRDTYGGPPGPPGPVIFCDLQKKNKNYDA